MPRRKWIDKSKATTYSLVHRPQHDPKFHDEATSSVVFKELAPPQAHKIKSRSDLELELFDSKYNEEALLRVRDNEGEAAEHGVYYDDTGYDYMQHMRDLNSGNSSGESYFVDAAGRNDKGKGKVGLEDALRSISLDEGRSEDNANNNRERLLDDDVLPSLHLRKTTYQDQQDVPDSLTGFQPDMDPRLREVLEALEDDAYVDDEEDAFEQLADGGEEISLAEFGELSFEDDGGEDGWESDNTTKPSHEYRAAEPQIDSIASPSGMRLEAEGDHGDGDWMAEFSKFKRDTKAKKMERPAVESKAELQSSIITGTSTASGRRKKRSGALTSSSSYSMTSASLARTEGLTLLDARFERIEEEYADDIMDDDDDGAASVVTGRMSTASGLSRLSKLSTTSRFSASSNKAPSLVARSDFDGIMDEFLDGYSMSGKRKVKKGRYQSGIQQLDEIRQELGRPRMYTQKAS